MEKKLGIIGAMEEEVVALIKGAEIIGERTIASLRIIEAVLAGQASVIVRCGVGKVNAALATQLLIDVYNVSAIINTGVAGSVTPETTIGDIVVSDIAVQHDMDCSPIGFDRGCIPFMETSVFFADEGLTELALNSAQKTIGNKRTHVGTIASGDQFIASPSAKAQIVEMFGALCTEMEGGAIAQVAFLNQRPFVIIRVISDNADDKAPHDFQHFLATVIPELNKIVIATAAGYAERCSE